MRLFKRKRSKDVAKDRLKILLISDRVSCSPEVLAMIKADIAKVISKYMKIDAGNMDIQISKTSAKGGRNAHQALHANIPILDLNKG